jgi:hypothetical protein
VSERLTGDCAQKPILELELYGKVYPTSFTLGYKCPIITEIPEYAFGLRDRYRTRIRIEHYSARVALTKCLEPHEHFSRYDLAGAILLARKNAQSHAPWQKLRIMLNVSNHRIHEVG